MSFNQWNCCFYWCDLKQRERHRMGATISSDLASQGGAQSNLVRERERRKKVTGFATLRKKLISRRRRSSKHDHGRILREFVSNWSPAELFSLLEEYEALSALKDLSMQAELARQPATTFKGDLSTLYDCKLCTDCDLVFRGNIFPVHRAILSGKNHKIKPTQFSLYKILFLPLQHDVHTFEICWPIVQAMVRV